EEIELSADGALAAHVVDDAVDPLLAIKRVVYLPHGMKIARKVQNDHAIVRHLAEQRRGRFFVPEFSAIVEEPALHDPHRVRLAGDDRLIDGVAVFGERVEPAFAIGWHRNFKLVKRIGKEVFRRAELMLPFLNELSSNLRIDRKSVV